MTNNNNMETTPINKYYLSYGNLVFVKALTTNTDAQYGSYSHFEYDEYHNFGISVCSSPAGTVNFKEVGMCKVHWMLFKRFLRNKLT